MMGDNKAVEVGVREKNDSVVVLDIGSEHMHRLNEASELWGITWEEALRRAIDEFWLKSKEIFAKFE